MQSVIENNLVSSINPRAKRLSLRVDNKTGVIRLSIPKWTMKRTIDRFLKNNEQWIAKRQAALLPKINIAHGSVIPFQGCDLTIEIINHTKRTTLIDVRDDRLVIQTSRADPSTNVKRWIVERAREVIEPLAQEKATHIGKAISKIDLRDPSSRWGSCSTDKRLMFSWRVIMAPPEVLDYLVAHEVANLKHMDHSKKFWDLCYSLCTGSEHGHDWLKQNGNTLLRYF
jgi:predicted metal-dependent hydrolase